MINSFTQESSTAKDLNYQQWIQTKTEQWWESYKIKYARLAFLINKILEELYNSDSNGIKTVLRERGNIMKEVKNYFNTSQINTTRVSQEEYLKKR